MDPARPLSSAQTLLSRYLIVPEAHFRILDTGLQHEMYDVFHLHWATRTGHMVGTFATLTGLAMLLHVGGSAVGGPTIGLAAAGLPLVGQWIYAAHLDRGVAVAILLPLLGICAAAWELVATAAPAQWAVVVVITGNIVQTESHLFEPVPPPWSGSVGWKPLGEVVRTATVPHLVGLVVLGLVAHVLELWAALRILSFQVLFVLTRLGYRPGLLQRTELRRSEILADYRRGWGPSAAGISRSKP